MRSLETAAQAGCLIVLALAGVVVTEAALAGFPAIRSGELPVWGLKVRCYLARCEGTLAPAMHRPPPCSGKTIAPVSLTCLTRLLLLC